MKALPQVERARPPCSKHPLHFFFMFRSVVSISCGCVVETSAIKIINIVTVIVGDSSHLMLSRCILVWKFGHCDVPTGLLNTSHCSDLLSDISLSSFHSGSFWAQLMRYFTGGKIINQVPGICVVRSLTCVFSHDHLSMGRPQEAQVLKIPHVYRSIGSRRRKQCATPPEMTKPDPTPTASELRGAVGLLRGVSWKPFALTAWVSYSYFSRCRCTLTLKAI